MKPTARSDPLCPSVKGADECFDEEDEETKIKGLFEDAGDDLNTFSNAPNSSES